MIIKVEMLKKKQGFAVFEATALVDNDIVASANLMCGFKRLRKRKEVMANIHSTAIIDSSAKIEPSVEIGAYTIVGKNVVIGSGSKIASHVVIQDNTEIGENNEIFQFSSIGEIPQDKKYQGEESKLIIGKNNTIREYCDK